MMYQHTLNQLRLSVMRIGTWMLVSCTALSLSSCGYHFQGSKNPLLVKEGVQKLYVAPLRNDTFKPGVENVVYNNLIRTLVAHRRVSLVRSASDSDAILEGVVQLANYLGSASTPVQSLNPTSVGPKLPTAGFYISTIYSASLTCLFRLKRTHPKQGQGSYLWERAFNRSKPFASANQLDVPGTTSSLINESEFDRALSDLAHSMMDDVHESMLAMF